MSREQREVITLKGVSPTVPGSIAAFKYDFWL
jgi:hypothetical protein